MSIKKVNKTEFLLIIGVIIMVVVIILFLKANVELGEKQTRGRPLTELESGSIYNQIFIEFIPRKGVELPTHLGTVVLCVTKKGESVDKRYYAEFDNMNLRDEKGDLISIFSIPQTFRYRKEMFRIKLKDGIWEEAEHWFIAIK